MAVMMAPQPAPAADGLLPSQGSPSITPSIELATTVERDPTPVDDSESVDGLDVIADADAATTVNREPHQPDQASQGASPTPLDDAQDEVQLVRAASTPSEAEAETQVRPEHEESFEKAAASSLVSPPPSSHNGGENASPSTEESSPSSASSSRHSLGEMKRIQRNTPESGPARRASSSVASEAPVDEAAVEDATPVAAAAAQSPSVVVEPDPKQVRARLGSESVADKESLRLIKELQAQDYGLRRRGRL